MLSCTHIYIYGGAQNWWKNFPHILQSISEVTAGTKLLYTFSAD